MITKLLDEPYWDELPKHINRWFGNRKGTHLYYLVGSQIASDHTKNIAQALLNKSFAFKKSKSKFHTYVPFTYNEAVDLENHLPYLKELMIEELNYFIDFTDASEPIRKINLENNLEVIFQILEDYQSDFK